MARRSRILTKILCVLVLVSTAAIPLVTSTTPIEVEVYGYIHLVDGDSVIQLANHPITITDDRTQSSQEVYTNEYGFFSYFIMEPEDALYTDTITLSTSYIDSDTQDVIYGSTTILISPYMRADPTFVPLIQDCEWYEDCEAPSSDNSPHSDQTVVDLYFSQGYTFEGDIVTIFADVKNIGDADLMEPTTVRFYDGDILLPDGEIPINSLNIGETETVQIQWTDDLPGIHSISVKVGQEKSFAEVNMVNNDLSNNIIVLTHNGDFDSDGLRNWDEFTVFNTDPLTFDSIVVMNNNWIVDHDMVCSDATVILNGDLIVQPGNSLTLYNFIIKMDSSVTQRNILVQNLGELRAYNSMILANDLTYPFLFSIHGGLQLINCKISHLEDGIQIYSNYAIITDSVISDSNVGIYIENGVHPSILIENSIFINIVNHDIELINSNIHLLDTIFDQGKLDLAGSTLTVERNIHVRVFDSNDNPAENINVQVPEVGFSGFTNSFGFVRDILVTDFVITQTGSTYYPHTVSIPSGYTAFEGYGTNPDISVRANEELTLNPAIFTLDGDPSTGWNREVDLENDYLEYDFANPITIGTITLEFISTGIIGATRIEAFISSTSEWVEVDTFEEEMNRHVRRVTLSSIEGEPLTRLKLNEPGLGWRYYLPLMYTQSNEPYPIPWREGEGIVIEFEGDPNDAHTWIAYLPNGMVAVLTDDGADLVNKLIEGKDFDPDSTIKIVMPSPDPRTWYIEITEPDGTTHQIYIFQSGTRRPGPVVQAGVDDPTDPRTIWWKADPTGDKHYPFQNVPDVEDILKDGDVSVLVNDDGTVTIIVTVDGKQIKYTMNPDDYEPQHGSIGEDEDGYYFENRFGDIFRPPDDYADKTQEYLENLLQQEGWTFVGQPSDPSTWRLVDPNGKVWKIDYPDFADAKMDTDGDKIPNLYEQVYFFDILGEDMDGDGKNNGPFDEDTDDDELTDFEEIEVVFRTNAVGTYGMGTWVAVDADVCGGLNGYSYSDESPITEEPKKFDGFTPEGYRYIISNDQSAVSIVIHPNIVRYGDRTERVDWELSPLPAGTFNFRETRKIGTDPANADTDDDGLSDLDEYNTFYAKRFYQMESAPRLIPDSGSTSLIIINAADGHANLHQVTINFAITHPDHNELRIAFGVPDNENGYGGWDLCVRDKEFIYAAPIHVREDTHEYSIDISDYLDPYFYFKELFGFWYLSAQDYSDGNVGTMDYFYIKTIGGTNPLVQDIDCDGLGDGFEISNDYVKSFYPFLPLKPWNIPDPGGIGLLLQGTEMENSGILISAKANFAITHPNQNELEIGLGLTECPEIDADGLNLFIRDEAIIYIPPSSIDGNTHEYSIELFNYLDREIIFRKAFSLLWTLSVIDHNAGNSGTIDYFKIVYTARTNPFNWDSENDGLSDGEEVQYGSNPFLEESDGDTLTDVDEVRTYGTNPGNYDMDGDGLCDREVLYMDDQNDDGIPDFDPDRPGDEPNGDFDEDTLSNAFELNSKYTAPNRADTDGDHIRDDRDKQPLNYNRRFAFIFEVHDFVIEGQDLSLNEGRNVANSLGDINFDHVYLVTDNNYDGEELDFVGTYVWYDEINAESIFGNEIDNFKSVTLDTPENKEGKDIVIVYMTSHGIETFDYYEFLLAWEITAIDEDYIDEQLDKFGDALDLIWISTCESEAAFDKWDSSDDLIVIGNDGTNWGGSSKWDAAMNGGVKWGGGISVGIDDGDYVESAFLAARQQEWDMDEDEGDHDGNLQIEDNYFGELYLT